jgi:hypothetical protein
VKYLSLATLFVSQMKITSTVSALVLLSGNAAAVYKFPGDFIYLGYTLSDAYPNSTSTLKVPVTALDSTLLDGWSQKWPHGAWTNPAAPQITLSYETKGKKSLIGLSTTGPRTTKTLFDENFYKRSGRMRNMKTTTKEEEETQEEDEDTKMQGANYRYPNALGTLDVSFRVGSVAVNNKETIPSNSADAAHSGWQEGGCVPSMGGSHYFKGDWKSDPPFVPIYDTAGTKELNSFILYFGNFGTEFGYLDGFVPNNGLGFDGYGIAVNTMLNCERSFCSNEDCVAYVDSIDDGGTSAMHVMFYDPSVIGDWATCGVNDPFACEACSCCGSSLGNCTTFPIWLP